MNYQSIYIIFLVAQTFTYDQFGEDNGPILLEKVSCNGRESRLSECSYQRFGGNFHHREDAGVRCLAGNFVTIYFNLGSPSIMVAKMSLRT